MTHCTGKLELYAIEALSPKEASDVRQHLSECAPCSAELKQVESLVGALHTVRTAYDHGATLREVPKVRRWKPWAAAAALLLAAIPATFWALRTKPTPPPPPVAARPSVIDIDPDTHLSLSEEAVYEISAENRILTLTEGSIECEIGGSSFTLKLPNGKVVGKAYKISAKVEPDRVTVKILQGSALYTDSKGNRHIVGGTRTLIQTINGITRISSFSSK